MHVYRYLRTIAKVYSHLLIVADLSINMTHIRNYNSTYLRFDFKSFSFTDGNSSPILKPAAQCQVWNIRHTLVSWYFLCELTWIQHAAQKDAVYLWAFIHPALFFDLLYSIRVFSRSSSLTAWGRECLSRLRHYQSGFLSMLSISFKRSWICRISELSIVTASYGCVPVGIWYGLLSSMHSISRSFFYW